MRWVSPHRASLPLWCVGLLLLLTAPAWGQQELRSGKKGASAPAPVTSTPIDADHEALDVAIKAGSITLSGADGAILDGANAAIKATVFDRTNSNPVATQLVDSNGDPVSVGGGTQYNQGTPTTDTDTLTMAGCVRVDTPAVATGVIDGDRARCIVDSTGRLWVHVGVVDGTISAIQSGAWNVGQSGSWTVSGTGNFTVVQPTGTNLHIVCDSGCGGAATFADNSAFTFGTTPVNIGGGVLDDTGTAACTENNACAPRITAQKAFHTNLRNNAGTEVGTSGAPLRVDPTGTTTQPVSGTVTANAGSGTFFDGIIRDGTGDTTQANVSSGRLQVDGSGVTQPVSAASLPLPSGASTLAEQQTQTTALQLIDNLPLTQGAATAGQNGVLAQGAVTTSAPTYTTGNTNPISLQTDGSQRVAVTNTPAVSQSGTWTVQPGNTANTTPWVVELSQTGTKNDVDVATLPNEGTQTAANSISVTIASDIASGATTMPTASAQGLVVRQPAACTSYAAISQTADTAVITATASQYIYICSIILVAGAAETVSIWEGTGTACGTSSAAMFGSTTETNGMAFAANGGFTMVAGQPFVRTASTNVDLCVRQNGTNRVSGMISYIKAP